MYHTYSKLKINSTFGHITQHFFIKIVALLYNWIHNEWASHVLVTSIDRLPTMTVDLREERMLGKLKSGWISRRLRTGCKGLNLQKT